MSNATRKKKKKKKKKKKNEDMVVVAEEGVLNTTSSLLLSAEKSTLRTLRWCCREIFCLRSFALRAHKVDENVCLSLSS